MRCKRWPRHAFRDTARKRAALRQKQQKERDALPLFADQIAAAQPDEDQVMQERADQWSAQEARDRNARAANWRRARRWIESLPDPERRAVRRAWNCAPYPADPSYLLSMLHSHGSGRIDLDRPPFPLSRTDPSGARIENLFATSDLFVTILKARDIAETPDAYPQPERHAAYHHLQAAADRNKDRARAIEDRALAAQLFLRLREFENAPANGTRDLQSPKPGPRSTHSTKSESKLSVE